MDGIKHEVQIQVVAMLLPRIGNLKHFFTPPRRPRPPPHAPPPAPLHPGRWRAAPRTAPTALAHRGWKQQARAAGHGPAGSPAWADSSDERCLKTLIQKLLQRWRRCGGLLRSETLGQKLVDVQDAAQARGAAYELQWGALRVC